MDSKALASRVRNVAARLENDGDEWGVVALLREAAAALSAGAEPVEYQFQDADGRWCSFHSDKHRIDTIADGRWPIRALYTRPQLATPASGWMLSVDQVLGYIPVNIEGWKGVPEGYMSGYNDALGICRASIRLAFAECRPLPAPPASTETDKQTAAEQAALERVQ